MRLLSPLVLHIDCFQRALAIDDSSCISRNDCNGNHVQTRRWIAFQVAPSEKTTSQGYNHWLKSRQTAEVSAMSPMPLLNNFDQKILRPKSFHNKSESNIDGTFFQKYAEAIKDTGLRKESELFTNNSKI